MAQISSDSLSAPSLARKLVAVAVAATLILGWASTAQAQTPADAQYGDPTESGTAALNQILDPPSGSDPASGGSSLTGASGGSGLQAASGSSSLTGASGSTGLTGLLPSTGGPLLPLALLGGLALSSAGLLMVRRNKRR